MAYWPASRVHSNRPGASPQSIRQPVMLGDYTAVAVADKCLVWDEHSRQFASHHAGLTRSEMRVPLIAVLK